MSRALRRALAGIAVLLLGACAVQPPAEPLPPDVHPQVRLETTLGDVTVELDRERAPVSVDNFLRYVAEHHYDGTIFHRVIPGFVVQGGGYDANGAERPTHAPIALEAGNGLSNLRGTIAMAREDAPDTATAQFYFNLVDNRKLDPQPTIPARRHGYAVFGRVVAGLDVIDAMAAVPTGVNRVLGAPDVPREAIVLKRATLLPRR